MNITEYREFLQKPNEWNIKDVISKNGVLLYKKLLTFNFLERYTAFQALKHPWITRNSTDDVPLNTN